jgi:hypothetical protein
MRIHTNARSVSKSIQNELLGMVITDVKVTTAHNKATGAYLSRITLKADSPGGKAGVKTLFDMPTTIILRGTGP